MPAERNSMTSVSGQIWRDGTNFPWVEGRLGDRWSSINGGEQEANYHCNVQVFRGNTEKSAGSDLCGGEWVADITVTIYYYCYYYYSNTVKLPKI